MGEAPKHMGNAAVPHAEGRSWYTVALQTGAVGVAAGILSLICCFVASLMIDSAGGWFNRFWFAFFWVCLFLVGFVTVNRSWLRTRPENVYLVIAVCVTMLFSWSISVREVGWDIGVHYRNILVFADWTGDVEHTVSDNMIITHAPLPQGEGDLVDSVNTREDELDDGADEYLETVERSKNLMWYVTGVEYIPYALVMRLCRLLGVSFSHTLLLMRVMGGLFYSIVTYLGMRKIRTGKMLYAVIALLPSSLFLAAELGYSYWLFSLCLYGFASLAGMMQGSVEVTPWSLAKMLGALFVGMLPRVVYFPLIFLCLLIPTSRFTSARFARWYRGLIVGAALLTFAVWLVPKLASGLGSGDARGGEVNPSAQIQYILTHPLEYANTFLRFVLPPLRMENGAADLEGVNLVSGFLSLEASPGLLANYGYLPRAHWAYTVVLWCLIAWTTLTDKDHDFHYGTLPGIVSLVLCLGVLILTVTALYFDFTPVGLSEIHGMQRRYTLPMAFPLFVFMGPSALGLVGGRPRVSIAVYNGVVLCGMAAVLLCSWWTTCVLALA